MKRYIALLRGINVGGKNKIAMAELKTSCSEIGFQEVASYLNSGNVIFSSETDDEHQLANDMQSMIKAKFALDIPVHVVLQTALQELLENTPDWWGNDNKEIYDNLIFFMPPLSYEAFYAEIGEPKAELEKVAPYKNNVFWSFSRKDYQKTNWWSKTASAKVKDQITIRTAGTVRKIVRM